MAVSREVSTRRSASAPCKRRALHLALLGNWLPLGPVWPWNNGLGGLGGDIGYLVSEQATFKLLRSLHQKKYRPDS